MNSVRLVLGSVALVALMFAGCGGEKTYTVTGKVTLPDGKPLTNGTVTFQGEGFQAYGATNKEGVYELEAQPGKYKVVVTQVEESGGEDEDFYEEGQGDDSGTPKDLKFDAKYTQSATSPLEVEISGDKEFDIKLE